MKICIKTYSVDKGFSGISDILSFLILVNEYFDLRDTIFTIPGVDASNDFKFSFDMINNNKFDYSFDQIQSIWLNKKNGKLSGSIQLDDSDNFFSLEVELDFERLDEVTNFFSDAKLISLIDFGYAYQTDIQTDIYLDISYGANENGLGIKAGLRDVYWLNYYGKEFVEMIGENKIKNLPAYKLHQLNDSILYVISKNPGEAYQLKEKIKGIIGDEFFVESIKSLKSIPQESNGVTGLFRHLFKLSKGPKDEREAKIRPSFKV